MVVPTSWIKANCTNLFDADERPSMPPTKEGANVVAGSAEVVGGNNELGWMGWMG